MKEHPILFSAPMVRAILEGRKTQTRRLVKARHFPKLERFLGGALDGKWNLIPLPYGKPGDRLWVREAWAVRRHEPCEFHERDWQELQSPTIRYLADGATRRVQGNRTTGVGIYRGPVEKARVSIHMPRWASRILVEITDVRVERVQDISEQDAVAEGCDAAQGLRDDDDLMVHVVQELRGFGSSFPVARFVLLWDSINAKRGFNWNANPLVWALTFRRVEPST